MLDALRPFDLAPGDYAAPMPASMKEMGSEEFKAKAGRGPRVTMTILSPSASMPRSLALWFVYSVVIAVFTAYVASVTLRAGAPYLTVFRVTATVTFIAYAFALWQGWLWYSRSLGYTIRTSIDGLIYGLLTRAALSVGCGLSARYA